MNPLQKKCVIATAGCHLLLVVILFLGPGFFRREPKPDSLPVLKVISLTAIDTALSEGSSQTQPPPPAPAPAPKPPVNPPPAPEPPKPAATPPTPTPEPPQPVEPVHPKAEPVEPEVKTEVDTVPVEHETKRRKEKKTEDTQEPVKPAPAKNIAKPKPNQIEVSLVPVITKPPHKQHPDTSREEEEAAAAAERAERAAQQARANGILGAATSLEHSLSSATDVKMVGSNSQDAANYGQIVKSIYFREWQLPDSADNDESSPKARVTIGRDGTVMNAHLIEPSGDAAVDASVRGVLDRVTFIKPFAEDSTDQERTFIIKFDLKTKRNL